MTATPPRSHRGRSSPKPSGPPSIACWPRSDQRLDRRRSAEFRDRVPHLRCPARAGRFQRHGALERALEVLDVGVGDDVLVTPRSFLASCPAWCVVVPVRCSPMSIVIHRCSPSRPRRSTNTSTRPSSSCIWRGAMRHAGHHGVGGDTRHQGDRGCAPGPWPPSTACPSGHGSHRLLLILSGQDHHRRRRGWSADHERRQAARRIWMLRDHGRDPERVASTDHPDSVGCRVAGTNDRMTEMQAAIGRIQLRIFPIASRPGVETPACCTMRFDLRGSVHRGHRIDSVTRGTGIIASSMRGRS